MEAMIELKNLTKRFDAFTAVDHLNLTIQTGEFFGLLGPNGAGKTTTISMLSTVLLPTEWGDFGDGKPLNRRRLSKSESSASSTQEYSMRQDMTMDEVMEYQGRSIFCPERSSASGPQSCWTLPACWSTASARFATSPGV